MSKEAGAEQLCTDAPLWQLSELDARCQTRPIRDLPVESRFWAGLLESLQAGEGGGRGEVS